MKIKNLVNQRFGKLIVVSYSSTAKGRAQWQCVCDCGVKLVLSGRQLTRKDKRHPSSCGCVPKVVARTHGLSKHPLYSAVIQQYRRCCDTSYHGFKYYGGRGIKFDFAGVDKAEIITHAIEYIENNLGPKPSKKHTIDRVDNNGNYAPGNLRWATKKEQVANRREGKKREGCTSKYKGITWCKRNKKWCVRCWIGGKRRHIAYVANESEAKRIYDKTIATQAV